MIAGENLLDGVAVVPARASRIAPLRRSWVVALICLAPAGCYYAFLLSAGSSGLFGPLPHGLTFNSMLSHLLDGRFDVDPNAIGDEGFLRDGATYAYFGIFPALPRVFFLPMAQFATTDFTRIGCLAAASLMAFFKVLSALTVGRHIGIARAPILLTVLIAAILVSGPQIQFLRPSIFQETASWAAACAAAFVYLVLRGWLREEGFTRGLLAALALVAGVCLLTRVSTALGLYLGFGFLWLRLAWCEYRAGSLRRNLVGMALPLAILGGFAAIVGYVNYQRWGDPLVFVDLSRQLIALTQYPDRLARVRDYGEFNPIRLLFGLGYYFLPIWVLRDAAGELLWAQFQQRTLDIVELPPSSLLVSDPLLIGLAVYGLVHLLHRRGLPRRDLVLPVLAGLLVPIGLILIAIAMAFRYRLEFYPFIELCAFAGFARLLAAPGTSSRIWFGAAALLGIVAAHAAWLLYMLSPFGPVTTTLGRTGVVDFYAGLFR